jgi:8-oxo-(d)GTP phosphatase
MADDSEPDQIRAAGAVLWRPGELGVEVALIHRPKYDDWSFAKGKLEPGEQTPLAAVREVSEETGLHVTLGRNLPHVHYLADGLRKRVDYWAAEAPAQRASFTPNREVDALEWVDATEAARRLSYAHDAQLLGEFQAGPSRTTPLILIRHASAGSKSDWRSADELRPLDRHGLQQALQLGRLMACFGSGRARVISSPAQRCLATVRPYAESAGASIEVEPAFAVADQDARAAGAAKAVKLARAAAAAVAGAAADTRPVVICAHRENMPVLLAAACEGLGAAVPAGPALRKGDFWILHRAGGQLAGAERHEPEVDDQSRG